MDLDLDWHRLVSGGKEGWLVYMGGVEVYWNLGGEQGENSGEEGFWIVIMSSTRENL